MIVYVLRTEPIDCLAELKGVWASRDQAIAAAVKLDPTLGEATWEDTNSDVESSWWAVIGPGRQYTDWVIEAVEYHP